MDEWLWNYYDPNIGFFSLAMDEKPNYEHHCVSWFLVGRKDSYIINKWHDETHKYWRENPWMKDKAELREYFWFFILFDKLWKLIEISISMV